MKLSRGVLVLVGVLFLGAGFVHHYLLSPGSEVELPTGELGDGEMATCTTDSECDDNDPCTTDTCDIVARTCVYTLVDSESCNPEFTGDVESETGDLVDDEDNDTEVEPALDDEEQVGDEDADLEEPDEELPPENDENNEDNDADNDEDDNNNNTGGSSGGGGDDGGSSSSAGNGGGGNNGGGNGNVCLPNCEGKQCGDNGCGGSCGSCGANEICSGEGLCKDLGLQPLCTPQCDGKECGDDGCGGNCGSCAPSQSCSAAGACVTFQLQNPDLVVDPDPIQDLQICTPNCNAKACGADDGCGNPCQSGVCPVGRECTNGVCTLMVDQPQFELDNQFDPIDPIDPVQPIQPGL